METKINWETVSFEIISKVGAGKGELLNGLQLAKAGKYTEAKEAIQRANGYIGEAGQAHMDVITEEANGIQHDFKVIFMHAEDQFLTTQTLALVINELIELYQKIDE